MNEAYVRGEVYNLLRRLWYWPHRLKDAHAAVGKNGMVLPPSGRPDILVNSAHGPGVYIEVKVLNLREGTSFPFSKITAQQRKYMVRAIEDEYRCYLALGTVNQNREMHGKRKLWIIDWPYWLMVEGTVREANQECLPYKVGAGYGKAMQDRELDMLSLLGEYACYRANNKWHVPHGHSLWQEKKKCLTERQL
jgi:hypothetical protein